MMIMRDKVLLLLIILLAIFFRFNNLNWDSGFHLHPDERFLTMVGNAMTMPMSFKEYFNPVVSTFNPANIGYKFYVYGILPLILNKIIALSTGADNYNFFTIQGRFLSAFADLMTIFVVYKTAKLLFSRERSRPFPTQRNIPLWAAFFYAVAVFPVQLSHFFAVDTFLNFFMLGSFYFALRYSVGNAYMRSLQYLFLSAVFFGLAMACKISAIYILPLILFFLFLRSLRDGSVLTSFKLIIFVLFVFGFFSYLTLRFTNPYYFQAANFFDPRINQDFSNNIKQLTVLSSGQISYPPAVQWYSKNLWSLTINTAVFGVGIPYFIFIILGILKIIISKSKIINKQHLVIVLFWVWGLFFYQSIQFVKSMRYTIYLYPFFAIFAAIGAQWLNVRFKYGLVIIFLLLIWPFMFSSIYMTKNSRVEASEWIYQNLTHNSFILSEHWDDGLPLPIDNNFGKQFQGAQLPVFDPDTPEKWNKINELLAKGDYYILSSNRGWGSIPAAPEKYPIMSKFYNDLLAGKTNYKLIKEFHSYPKLEIGNRKLEINDDWSEELFSVYDHPKVLIFQNKNK